jgi:hypothetical protein
MRRFRTHWLALMGAMLLLSLSVSSAFGHHPSHPDNRGNAVSTFVHELLLGSDEESEEEQEDEGDEEEGDEEEGDEEESLDGDGDNHGQCVRDYARDHLLLGANDTHGWAVSEAARVLCVDDGEDEGSTEDSDQEDEGDDGDQDSATAKDRGDRGKSAAAHQKAPGKNKADGARGGHGMGQGNGNAGGNGNGRGKA